MFEISVGELLNTHPGNSITLAYDGVVPKETWTDLDIIDNLAFTVQLIALEHGIDAIITKLSCTATYEEITRPITLKKVERTFVKHLSGDMPDDINEIHMKHASIDLGKVLREEIIMSLL